MHFLPKEIPKQKKFLTMSLFLIHIAILINSLLNFFDSCAQGGLRILYSFLFILAFNPLILLLFYRGTSPPIQALPASVSTAATCDSTSSCSPSPYS
jgi:hypothetical protein